MNARDKIILNDLERFRCLTRDDVAELHFSHTKQPITQANIVLKRMRRDGLIKCSTERRKYIYFPYALNMKKDSQKINHFLLIAQFYKDVRKSSIPKEFIVEPKYGSKFMEPDIFMIWKGTPFFVEVQRTVYTDKVMKAKIDRYELYFNSGEWQREPWQPKDKKVFPYIWIIGVGKYSTGIRPFRVIQNSVEEMLKQVK
ncbi:hypothetical protein PBAT_02080 [Paenibacillus antarcticus]|uniref:Replication-relaxation n=2 Tax=Paenibacillus antarcticus TaxID=253703 RepID=A0A168R0S0_9BACL|nr:replication-relaxation family protein [Paenibacillus antarcticus]OAB48442.1 hypothetical protein PBAT_02080 [Paenibacillus antarcticus]